MNNPTEHNFIQKEAGGASFETSWSFQKCQDCGVCFTHKYNIESYEDAIKRSGINYKCNKNINT